MISQEMKNLLSQISDLCYKASEEVYENEETEDILILCDQLHEMIDDYLNVE